MQDQQAAWHYTSSTVFINIIVASNEPLITFCEYNNHGVDMMPYSKTHAKSGPFWRNEVEQGNPFRLFSMFLSVLTSGYVPELAASEKQTVPCQMSLEFDRDGAVMPLVYYD